MAYLNLEIPDEHRDALKAEAKRLGMKFYPFASKELIKVAERLNKKDKKND